MSNIEKSSLKHGYSRIEARLSVRFNLNVDISSIVSFSLLNEDTSKTIGVYAGYDL